MSPHNYATQIWPFRESFGADMPATLEKLAQTGFAGVELCRWFDWTDLFDKWAADEIHRVCEGFGLQVVSAHITFPMIAEQNLAEVIDFAHQVGMKYVVVAAVPEEQVTTHTAVLQVADQFNWAAATLKPEGIRLGYHNHSFDFKPLPEDGGLPWKIFFDNTDPEVVMQLDIGNALYCGTDPIPYLKKYPGRARLVHLKEYSAHRPPAAIGDGEINWTQVFEICEELHQPEWYILEQEEQGYDVWESAAQSLKYLRELGR